MARLRIIFILALVSVMIQGWGQDGFNPFDPPEPGLPAMKLEVLASPSEAGSVSGGGRYVAGTEVGLYAYVNNGFRFVNWTDSKGKILSTSQSFSYTKGDGHEKLTANYLFDPDSPIEPDDPNKILYYLSLSATEGGSVSGGGRYLAGEQVTIAAYPYSHFDFEGWYNADGELISTNAYFLYTTTSKHLTFQARFKFNPESPGEPTMPGNYHTITATAKDGGTINFSSQRAEEGSSVDLRAYPNSGYVFTGWYLNGVLYSVEQYCSYTVTSQSHQEFEARFEFNPDAPPEPDPSTKNSYAIYLPNHVAKPGDLVRFPVFISNVSQLKDITFMLTFDSELKPDINSLELSQNAIGYTASYKAENSNTYTFTFTGGQLPAGNSPFVTIQIPISEKIITAKKYPVTISQVSVMKEDGTTQTASTRNGGISVYKLGDSNGDDAVNVADLVGVSRFIYDVPEDNLVFYASDMDGNEVVERLDYDILVDSILCAEKSMRSSTAIMSPSKIMPMEEVSIIDSGTRKIKVPISFINKSSITGFQFEIVCPKDIDVPTDENGDFVIELNSSRMSSHKIHARKSQDGTLHIICSSIQYNSYFSKDEDELFYITLRAGNNTSDGTYTVKLKNIIMTDEHSVDSWQEDIEINVTVKNASDFIKGDVNRDGTVNVADIVEVANYIMGNPSNNFNEALSDANGDGAVNAADVVEIVNIIMKSN